MRGFLFALTMLGAPAWGDNLPMFAGGKQIGAASLGVLGIKAYDGRLFTLGGAPFDWNAPMALELTYQRNFTAADLVTGTEAEMTRIEGRNVADTVAALTPCFADVSEGDRFVAVGLSPDRIALWLNGAQRCDVAYPAIRQRFLSIWLSDNARFANLSRKLRGL